MTLATNESSRPYMDETGNTGGDDSKRNTQEPSTGLQIPDIFEGDESLRKQDNFENTQMTFKTKQKFSLPPADGK